MKTTAPVLALLSLFLAACGGCPDDFARACAKKGCVEKVKAALAKDPSLLSKPDESGLFPLHTAADAPIAEALLAAGADIEQVGGSQQSPLGAALSRNRGEVVSVLLAHGAKIIDMRSVMRREVGDNHASSLEALLAGGGAADDESLLHAVLNDKVAAAEVLLKHGANANASVPAGMSVITIGGPAPGGRDAGGKTVLELAKSDAMKALLKKNGAN